MLTWYEVTEEWQVVRGAGFTELVRCRLLRNDQDLIMVFVADGHTDFLEACRYNLNSSRETRVGSVLMASS